MPIIPPPLPPRPKTQKIGEVRLTQSVSLKNAFSKIATKHTDHIPHYMEHYGQDYGMILYHTEIEGIYPAGTVGADGVHDIAYVYVDGKQIGKYNRAEPLKKSIKNIGAVKSDSFNFPVPAFNGKITLDILVEGMGRINFNKQIHDSKGLYMARIGEQYVYDYDIYSLPIHEVDKLDFDGSRDFSGYLKGTFKALSEADCFISMRGFTKGYVFVNGINLGRYWNVGPQRMLYLPGVWLKEENEIVIFELEGCKEASVTITDKPCFK